MSDSAYVVFRDKQGYSPAIYLHREHNVRDKIDWALSVLRTNDASYSAARFCGVICAEAPYSKIGVGLRDSPTDFDIIKDAFADYAKDADQGIYVVDIRDGVAFDVTNYLDGQMVQSWVLHPPKER